MKDLINLLRTALDGAYIEVYQEEIESSSVFMQNEEFNNSEVEFTDGTRIVVELGDERREYSANSNAIDPIIKKILEDFNKLMPEKVVDHHVLQKTATTDDFQYSDQIQSEVIEMIEKSNSYIRENSEVLSLSIAFSYKLHTYFAYNTNTNTIIEEQLNPISLRSEGIIKNNDGKDVSLTTRHGGTNWWNLLKDLYFENIKDSLKSTLIPYKSLDEGREIEVVLANSSNGGVLFHEAIGHPLEQDIFKNAIFEDNWDSLSFHESVNVVDNPGVEHSFGYYQYDHEGYPAKKTYLIKDGKLSETMKSYTTSKDQTTGHGRREDFRYETLVRMSTTYLDNGNEDPQDIIKSVKDGVYITKIGGGQVNIKSGEFVFQAKEAFHIKDGVVQQQRLSNLTIKGCGPDVLQNITMVGNDLNISKEHIVNEAGYCGKGQTMRVGDSCPTFKTKIYVA